MTNHTVLDTLSLDTILDPQKNVMRPLRNYVTRHRQSVFQILFKTISNFTLLFETGISNIEIVLRIKGTVDNCTLARTHYCVKVNRLV